MEEEEQYSKLPFRERLCVLRLYINDMCVRTSSEDAYWIISELLTDWKNEFENVHLQVGFGITFL
jgi:hypothetical protein